jgi:hypothetical protein
MKRKIKHSAYLFLIEDCTDAFLALMKEFDGVIMF